MKHVRKVSAIAMVAAALVSASAVADQAGGRFGLAVGIDYSTGKYGGTQSTDTTYIPVIGRYETDSWLFKVTVPYVSITGPGTVVGGDRPTVIQGASTTRNTESGVGDVVGAVTWSAVQTEGFFLDLTAKVKFATGDEAAGLSTGKNDYSFQVDVYKPLGSLTPFAGVGYRKYGDPVGLDLRNAMFANVGVSWKATAKVSLGVSVDYREAIVVNKDPIVEATPFLSWKLDDRNKLQVYAVRGFTDASTDWGGGVLLLHTF